MIRRRRGATASAAATMWLALSPAAVPSSSFSLGRAASSPSVVVAAFAFGGGGRGGGLDGPRAAGGGVREPTTRTSRADPMRWKGGRHMLALASVGRSSSYETADCAAESSTRPSNTLTSSVPLPQLLELLNERNVRYSPDATRADLEELLRMHAEDDAARSKSEFEAEGAATASRASESETARPIETPAPSDDDDANESAHRPDDRNENVDADADAIVDAEVLDEDRRRRARPDDGGSRRTRERREYSPRQRQQQQRGQRYDGMHDAPLSSMSLPQLLDLLNERNVRYSPDATRAELEELMRLHNASASRASEGETAQPIKPPTSSNDDDAINSTHPNDRSRRKRIETNSVVDAEVLDGHRRTRAEGTTRRATEGRRSSPPPRPQRRKNQQRRPSEQYQRQQRQGYDESYGQHRTRDARQGEWDREDRRRRNYYQRQGWDEEDQRRRRNYERQYYDQQRREQRGRREEDAIDLEEFRPSDYDGDDDDGQNYDNGMQIFLMGFAEAGKTAARLAVDSINPFSGDVYDDWHDDEGGARDGGVLDADILEYSPRYGLVGGSSRGRAGEGRPGRRRRAGRDRRRYYEAPLRRARDDRDGGTSYYDTDASPGGRRRSDAADAADPESSPSPAASGPADGGAGVGDDRRGRRVRGEGGEGGPRPIYGLYHGEDTNDDEPAPNEAPGTRSRRGEHGDKQEWKDRLRHKFDAALGLQSPSSSTGDTYYDSWKAHVEEVDEGRKEALRRRRDAGSDAADEAADEATDSGRSETRPRDPRRNRRARMRAARRSGSDGGRSPAPPSRPGAKRSEGSRLDEVPFWREGGTIASLLFDTRPSPPPGGARDGRDGRRPTRRKSLEHFILSPFGRDHTVTSLFLYSSRSLLAGFGVLSRWAGVRGTIPQPIVVTTVFAALISARPGQRAASVALTVLGLRLVGEFVHGSLHGNEFWEDRYDHEEHDWKDDTHYP